MPKHGMAIDHVCMAPQGRISMTYATSRPTKHQMRMRRRATTRSHVATTKLRAKLHRVDVVQHDSSWCHAVDGNIVARFATVGDAVSAL